MLFPAVKDSRVYLSSTWKPTSSTAPRALTVMLGDLVPVYIAGGVREAKGGGKTIPEDAP